MAEEQKADKREAQLEYCLRLLINAAKENRVPYKGVVDMSESILNSLKPKKK